MIQIEIDPVFRYEVDLRFINKHYKQINNKL